MFRIHGLKYSSHYHIIIANYGHIRTGSYHHVYDIPLFSMKHLSIEWAIDVAQVLRNRRIHAKSLGSDEHTDKLINALLSNPTSNSWEYVIDKWMGPIS